MKPFLTLLVCVITLAGCASTSSNVTKAYTPSLDSPVSLSVQKDSTLYIPDAQYQLIDTQIRNGLAKNGLLAGSESNAKHQVTVSIYSFRMRDDAARLIVGILAGCDNIASMVTVTDIATKQQLGNTQISIKECAAWGVASQVIKKYADGVVDSLAKK